MITRSYKKHFKEKHLRGFWLVSRPWNISPCKDKVWHSLTFSRHKFFFHLSMASLIDGDCGLWNGNSILLLYQSTNIMPIVELSCSLKSCLRPLLLSCLFPFVFLLSWDVCRICNCLPGCSWTILSTGMCSARIILTSKRDYWREIRFNGLKTIQTVKRNVSANRPSQRSKITALKTSV